MRNGLKWTAATLGAIIGTVPTTMWYLCGLILLDILTGLWSAWVRRCITSEHSFRGMSKKIAIVLLPIVAAIVQRTAGEHVALPAGISLAAACASVFCVTEAISIMENLSHMGVPIPAILTNVLARAKRSVATESSTAAASTER